MNIFMCCGYVPPKANCKSASTITTGLVSRHQSKYAPVIIVGNFNSCTLDGVLPSYQKNVTGPTRHNKTIDLCYSSVDDAYTSQCLPLLGQTDHNIVHLLPKYCQKLIKLVKVWTTDAVEQLKGCYACTDWDVIFEGTLDINERADILTDYVKFCQDSTIPEISLNGNMLPFTNNPVYLGVTFDRSLTYKEHLVKAAKKVNSVLVR